MEKHCPLCGHPNPIEEGLGFVRCAARFCTAIFQKNNLANAAPNERDAAAGKYGTLLIDFGTSSIRVGLRTSDKKISLLRLASYQSDTYLSSEEFEIKSWIFIDPKRSRVYFGDEAASRASLARRDGIYFKSPKNWLTKEFENIDSPPNGLAELSISRFALLAGLLAHALKPIEIAEQVRFDELEIRLSHPVFEDDDWSEQKLVFEQLLASAVIICQGVDQTQGIHLAQLPTRGQVPRSYSFIDVAEPVAAAVHQFENANNSREVCAVVDVGAGTTDFGLFASLTPDYSSENSGKFPRRFKAIAAPLSLQMAGDFIDDVIIEIFSDKLDAWLIDRLRLEVREEKAKIFNTGRTIYHDCTLSEIELVGHEKILRFQEIIRETFMSMLISAREELKELCSFRVHAVNQLNVVFVGGGGNLPFVRNAIPERIDFGELFSLPVIKLGGRNSTNAVGVSSVSDRFSVVYGGLTPWREWPMDSTSTILTGGLDVMPMKGVSNLDGA